MGFDMASRSRRVKELANEAYLAMITAVEKELQAPQTQQTLLLLRNELGLTQEDHMRTIQQLISSKARGGMGSAPKPLMMPDPSPEASTMSDSFEGSTPKSRSRPKASASKPARQRPAPKPKQQKAPAQRASPAPRVQVAAPAPTPAPPPAPAPAPQVKRTPPAVGNRKTLMMGAPNASDYPPEIHLVGRTIKKKRQLRDKTHMDGIIYDFDINSHEHLVVYNPGQRTEEFEWFNVHEMSDKQGLVVPGEPLTPSSMPRTSCAHHVSG